MCHTHVFFLKFTSPRLREIRLGQLSQPNLSASIRTPNDCEVYSNNNVGFFSTTYPSCERGVIVETRRRKVGRAGKTYICGSYKTYTREKY